MIKLLLLCLWLCGYYGYNGYYGYMVTNAQSLWIFRHGLKFNACKTQLIRFGLSHL